ncbi:MAG: hypothetical protein L0I76_27915, partial [Pseudonocardia sp.]|nr:hypothetical protein [Pseudonocardia sp.]
MRRAFAHVAELGDREASRRLRAEVLRQSARERPAAFEAMLQRSMNHDPAGGRGTTERRVASGSGRLG